MGKESRRKIGEWYWRSRDIRNAQQDLDYGRLTIFRSWTKLPLLQVLQYCIHVFDHRLAGLGEPLELARRAYKTMDERVARAGSESDDRPQDRERVGRGDWCHSADLNHRGLSRLRCFVRRQAVLQHPFIARSNGKVDAVNRPALEKPGASRDDARRLHDGQIILAVS